VVTAAELRELSDAELAERHDTYKQQLFDLRFALVTGQLDDTTRLRQARRDIARVRTIQRERDIEGSAAQGVLPQGEGTSE
jgi:large subunit ribosomal protein L29